MEERQEEIQFATGHRNPCNPRTSHIILKFDKAKAYLKGDAIWSQFPY